MVMGRDSRSKGCGFESRHRMLDGHFFTYICCKICLEKPKINENAAGVGPFKKNYLIGAVAVAQLVEWSLPIAEVCGSKSVIGKIFIYLLSTVLKRRK